MLINILSTQAKRWTIILTVETMDFLANNGYNITPDTKIRLFRFRLSGFSCSHPT